MKFHFYDIESLSNLFSVSYFLQDENLCEIYFLCDNKELITNDLESKIKEKIKIDTEFEGEIKLYNLDDMNSIKSLVQRFGISDSDNVTNKKIHDNFSQFKELRPICTTDKEYDEEKYPYILGYNSYNYDTTMIALYFANIFDIEYIGNKPKIKIKKIKAQDLRKYNNDLFSKEYKQNMPKYLRSEKFGYNSLAFKIRNNMLLTGRYLDVAKLNEKQVKVALKRIVGMLGGPILESEFLKDSKDIINTTDELVDLLVYNVSDTYILYKYVFCHKSYKIPFEQKRQLLITYPELIYKKDEYAYKPKIAEDNVRTGGKNELPRLCIDSTSAQFVSLALSPYGHIKDFDSVSFMYPSEEKAKETGIKRRNILEECKEFFYNLYSDESLRKQFDEIYKFYKSIEGKNFNSSINYTKDHVNPLPVSDLSKDSKDIYQANTILPYFDKNGKETSCFANFSVGGIHGAEYNLELFNYDLDEYNKKYELLEKIKNMFDSPDEAKKAKEIEIDNIKYKTKDFIKTNTKTKEVSYKEIKKPSLEKDGKFNEKYTFTSNALTNHEDFDSYYPNLLINLGVFDNKQLGYDRYSEIYKDKQKYGKLKKQKGLSQEEIDYYETKRNGTKLLLNTASGAGDAKYDNNIRVNNAIISMRIIGQLFSWRIGQAQAYKGAKIISTNTDGLYSELEESLNNQILEKESKTINVTIEPEQLFLISKDSNNRLEYDIYSGKIISAKGGSLACRDGIDPTKSLSHPAIVDWALAEYLKTVGSNDTNFPNLYDCVDEKLLDLIFKKIDKVFETPQNKLIMFQNIISSSNSTITFAVGVKNNKFLQLQHYNRVFYYKNESKETINIKYVCAKKITPATIKKREKNNEQIRQHDKVAYDILQNYGIDFNDYGEDKEATFKKIPNIEENWNMYVFNKGIKSLSDEKANEIYQNLDMDIYKNLVIKAYMTSWKNYKPNEEKLIIEEITEE